MYENKSDKRFNRKNKVIVTLLFALMLAVPLVGTVSATATISPSSGTVMLGLPQQFMVSGLNSSLTYDVYVDDVLTYSTIAPSTAGEIIFSVTFTAEGNHNVVVKQSTTTVATASVYGMDIIAYFIGFLSIAFIIVLVVKVFNRAGDLA